MERKKIATFFIVFLSQNSATAIFFSAAPTVALIQNHFLSSSATSRTEEIRLVRRCFYLQQIPLVTTPVEACSSFRIFDQFVFRWLNLERIHVILRVDLTWVEHELVSRNTE